MGIFRVSKPDTTTPAHRTVAFLVSILRLGIEEPHAIDQVAATPAHQSKFHTSAFFYKKSIEQYQATLKHQIYSTMSA